MRDLTPSHTFGSSSFIDGQFNVVHRLSSFVETFEKECLDAISDAVAVANYEVKAAAGSKWGSAIAKDVGAQLDDDVIVYSAKTKSSQEVADLEFGKAPKPVLRPTAIKHSKTLSKKLSESLSNRIPSA